MLADPDRPLAEAPLLSSDEYEVVTRTWACAARPADPPPVQAAFDAQRRRTPHAPAAVWHDRQLTYEELGAAADRLAHQLIRTGSSGLPVGILMDRCLDMTVAVLAVLKSGSPYVPLDPAYPADRLAYMIEDSGLHTLLTQPHLRDRCAVPPSVRVLGPEQWNTEVRPHPSDPGLPESGPHDLAYLMYTSGSTGKPKGVAMPHGPVSGLVQWQCRDSAAGPGDRTLQFSALSFDASFLEFFSTWSTGGTLVIIDADQRTDYDALLEVLAEQRVMRIFLPFVALQSIAFYATAMDLPTPAAARVRHRGRATPCDPGHPRVLRPTRRCRAVQPVRSHGDAQCELAAPGRRPGKLASHADHRLSDQRRRSPHSRRTSAPSAGWSGRRAVRRGPAGVEGVLGAARSDGTEVRSASSGRRHGGPLSHR